MIRLAIATLALTFAGEVLACPICNSTTGLAVRSTIFGQDFFKTFWEVLAPFPLLAVSVYAINRSLPG